MTTTTTTYLFDPASVRALYLRARLSRFRLSRQIALGLKVQCRGRDLLAQKMEETGTLPVPDQ